MRTKLRVAELLATGVVLFGSGVLGAEGREAEGVYEVRHEDGKVWITGMEDMDWGGSFFTQQDSFMACLVQILRCAGRQADYEDVMGLSAQAFKLTLPESLHPGAAQGHVGYAAFADDGTPMIFEPSGGPMNFHANAMRVFGIEWTHIDLNPEETPDWRERLLAAVRENVDRGLPIYYMDGEWGLVVGYREDGSAFICKSYPGLTPGYEEMERPHGVIGDAWWANVAAPTKEPMPRDQAVVESLRSAVILARTESFLDGEVASGFAAYEIWIWVLEDWEGEGPRQGNGFHYSQLLTSREAASLYLRGIAEGMEGDAAEHLHTAADRYRAIVDRLALAQDCVVWWDGDWGAEDRAIEVEALRGCLADERAAIAEVEAALALLQD